MREYIELPVLLVSFIAGSVILHWLVTVSEITGLPSFLIFSVPLLAVIAYTTANDGESFFHSFLRNGFWGYSFILAVAGLAWILS